MDGVNAQLPAVQADAEPAQSPADSKRAEGPFALPEEVPQAVYMEVNEALPIPGRIPWSAEGPAERRCPPAVVRAMFVSAGVVTAVFAAYGVYLAAT